MTVEEIADLHYDGGYGAVETTALTLHLDRGSDYFLPQDGGHVPRTVEDLEGPPREAAARGRKRRGCQDAHGRAEFTRAPPTPCHACTRGYWNTSRDSPYMGTSTLAAMPPIPCCVMRPTGRAIFSDGHFDLLVGAGVFSEDEPLELRRAEIEEDFPKAALEEAEAIPRNPLSDDRERLDLTGVETFTIDDAEHTRP